MRLIKKSNADAVVRELTAEEADSVRRHCGAGRQTEPQDAATVADILKAMRDGRETTLWLECDCRGTVVKGSKQPRLTARGREQGPLHFVRLNGYGPHLCELQAFRTAPDDDDDDELSEPQPGKHRPLRPVNDTLDYLDDEQQLGGSKRPGGKTGTAGGRPGSATRLPKLGRILYTILDDAGFNRLLAANASSSTTAENRSWDRIKTFAESEEITDSLSLQKILFTEPWVKPADKLREIDVLPWPKRKKRSALLLFVADKVSTSEVVKQTRIGPAAITPEHGVRIGGRDQNFANPPYWVLAIVDRDKDGRARVREAFAQHAYTSKHPVPLDSDYERKTLAQLLKITAWVKKKGVDVEITKPLFDSEVTLDSGEPAWCRADFELEFLEPGRDGTSARRHRLVIETMGSESEEYLAQKSGTHAIMRRRGVLVEHVVRNDDQQNERDGEFFRRVSGYILNLAGIARAAGGT